MIDEPNEGLEDVVAELRAPVAVSPSFDDRVMQAVRAFPPVRRLTVWGRLWLPRTVTLTPLPSALLAASLIIVAVLGGAAGTRAVVGRQAAREQSAVAGAATRSQGARPVQFVLVAPTARKVAVAGDFNDWNPQHADFVARHQGGGVWSVTASIPAGHHRYSFVVDDSVWVADPAAPRVIDPDFGQPASALVVEDNEGLR